MHEQPTASELDAGTPSESPSALYRLSPGSPPSTLAVADSIEALCGDSPDALIGDPKLWLERVVPEHRDRLTAAWQRAMVRGDGDIEYELVAADGTRRRVHDRFTLVRSQSGPDEIIGERALVAPAALPPVVTPLVPASFQHGLFEHLPIGLALNRLDGQLVQVNPAYARIIGRSVEETLALTYWNITPSEYAEQEQAQLDALTRTGHYGPYEKHYIHRDGHRVPVRLSGLLVEHGGETYIWSSVEDISDLKASEQELRRSEAELRAIIDNLPDTFYRTDAAGQIVLVSQTVTRLLGWTPQELRGRKLAQLYVDPNGRERFLSALAASDGVLHGFEAELWRKDGSTVWVSTSSHYWLDADGNVQGVEGAARDVTALRQTQEQLDHLAHHDPLTGLANRLVFDDRLAHAIEAAGRNDSGLAVLFMDLDRFKDINDSFGHPAGDKLLLDAARRLSRCVRRQDTVARLGGDEFIVLMEAVRDPQDAASLARKLIDAFATPFEVAGHQLRLTLSVGISLYPRDGGDVAALVKNADAAMYRAKEEGRDGFRFYTERLTAAAFERLTLETALRRAVQDGAFELHYQPQVSMADGHLLGAEALVRWRHPELGLVYPDNFIPLAERVGLLGEIGEWVMRSACAQLCTWDEAGLSLPRLSVNIAVAQVQDTGFPDRVAACMMRSGVTPERVELEITESFVMHKRRQAVRTLNRLQELGVSVAIDDFGTGYSSLSQLKQLPINKLKIDKSFVRDIPADRNDEAITLAVIALARSLGLDVIAEGVETSEQREFLQGHGCMAGQGILFSPPLPAADFAARWLDTTAS